MNRRRIIGLILLACIVILLAIRGCLPSHRAAEPAPPPPRDVFDSTKPFVLRVISGNANDAGHEAGHDTWLARELKSLLSLAGLQIAASRPDAPTRLFELQVLYSGTAAELRLIAPDQVVERQESIAFTDASRLQVTKELLRHLLNVVGHASNRNVELALDFEPANFDALTEAMDEIEGANSRGFTDVGDKVSHAQAVTKLERIARLHPRNPRALGALALAYLSVGGPDHQSLLDLAEKTAQRSLSLNQQFADSHAALGLVAFRRNQWTSARESLDRAIKVDPNSLPALEGLACVLANAGQLRQASAYAKRTLALHRENVGARDCLSYSQPLQPQDATQTSAQKSAAAMVAATVAMLGDDYSSARKLLSAATSASAMRAWGESLLDAAQHPAHISVALQKVTEAALEDRIDSTQVLLSGAALKNSDFVFNRITRLRVEQEPEPVRIVWLPQAAFLRKHPRFERIVSDAELPAYWHEYGRPDICNSEPTVYGCSESSSTHPSSSRQSSSPR
ncbi:MAG TPA: hypothetical protein VFS47_03495 [Steroidobacteraceae bacterium]|nr:hypothetical protein [Steroidobacteraceae bacterium]